MIVLNTLSLASHIVRYADFMPNGYGEFDRESSHETVHYGSVRNGGISIVDWDTDTIAESKNCLSTTLWYSDIRARITH